MAPHSLFSCCFLFSPHLVTSRQYHTIYSSNWYHFIFFTFCAFCAGSDVEKVIERAKIKLQIVDLNLFMDCKTEQEEEIEVLQSIYGSDFKSDSDEDTSYSIKISSDIKLFVTLPENYPKQSPPTYQLLAPTLNRETKRKINNDFDHIYANNVGLAVLFQWFEHLREVVREVHDCSSRDERELSDESRVVVQDVKPCSNFNIVHGKSIYDRKSTFQGHCSLVKTSDDVRLVLQQLMEIKKISQATHNIYAYRIKTAHGYQKDCADDGEHGAGAKLANLLDILDVNNVLVVVSRWYGGIHLGPDRFRHINNSAREALKEAEIIQ